MNTLRSLLTTQGWPHLELMTCHAGRKAVNAEGDSLRRNRKW